MHIPHSAITEPSGATQTSEGRNQVSWLESMSAATASYPAPDGRIERRAIALGPDDQHGVAVVGGNLAPGETVILARAHPPTTKHLFGIQF